MNGRSSIDAHVGSRVKLRRLTLGISQERLADKLGITFQQVQKYEKGTNRISASRLYAVADVLEVPISFFFEGAPGHSESGRLAESYAAASIVDFVSSKEGLDLNLAFSRIVDSKMRRRVLKLVGAIAGPSDDE